MRVGLIILAVTSAASALPVPVSTDLDLGYDVSDTDDWFLDPGSDLFTSGLASDNSGTFLVDSNEPLLLAGTPKVSGFDQSWTDPRDSSWTGVARPSAQNDGSYQTPEEKFIQGEKGEDYAGDYNRQPPPTVTTEVGAPTSFELSPGQADAITDGAAWVINGLSKVGAPIKALNDAVGDLVPSVPGS